MNPDLMVYILEIIYQQIIINVINVLNVINLDEYEDQGTHWIALYVKNKKVVCFDSFGVEHAPKEIIKFITNKDIIANIFRLQAYDSIMCGYFCINIIDMFDDKTLIDYTNLFSPHDFKKNDEIIKDIIINQKISKNDIIIKDIIIN